MTIARPQPISDRIAAWKQAYDAVLAELAMPETLRPVIDPHVREEPLYAVDMAKWRMELAARTAATLAIGATTRERGE